MAGGLVYLLLAKFNINELAAATISGLSVVLVRELSIKLNWNLPKVVSR
jgi:hypothetical protein